MGSELLAFLLGMFVIVIALLFAVAHRRRRHQPTGPNSREPIRENVVIKKRT